jgi:hypothetical protein
MADQVIRNQVGFAPEIAPFAQNLMGMAQGQAFTYARNPDGSVKLGADGLPQISGFQQQPSYKQWAAQQGLKSDARNAQFTPLQNKAFTAAETLGTNQYSTDAAVGLADLASTAGKTKYTPTTYSNQYTAPKDYTPQSFSRESVTAPALKNYQMQGPADVKAERVNAPQLQALSMQAAKDVGTQSLTQPGTVDQYMSPYMQKVVGIQQREAQRNADIAKTQTNAQAVKAGAFGGSRQAIMNAEAARNLATQKGDIQAKGSQDAYTQAQAQFNAEQQARLQANLANQNVQQQANLQNLSAGLQTQGLGAQTGLQAQQSNQQTGLQALLANQSMGYNVNNANLQSNLAQQQLGSGQSLQAQLANQQQYMAMQQAQEQANQFGYGQQMNNAQNQAQYGQAANQLNAQQSQFGAGLGLQGLQAGMTGYQNLGNQGQSLYGQNMGNINLQNQFGTQMQQNVQNQLTTDYQDYLTAQNNPYKQMGFLSDMYRGAPLSQQGSTMYTSGPSTLNQVAGLGMAAAGAYGAYNSAQGRPYNEGGSITETPRSAGLAELLVHNMA